MCNTKKFQKYFILVFAVIMLTVLAGGALAAEKITIYHAGSLSAPMAKIEALYEAANPGVDVLRESGGSAALARKITDLGGGCDVFLSADYMVIEKLLRPAGANWNVTFASNAIVLMYGPKSKHKKLDSGHDEAGCALGALRARCRPLRIQESYGPPAGREVLW